MIDEPLISQIRARASDPATRTDWRVAEPTQLPPTATSEQLSKAAAEIGCQFHPVHRTMLLEIANGGFGPGHGLIGLHGGSTDDDGRSLVELQRELLSGDVALGGVVPLWDWGDGAWACLKEDSGTILTIDENGIFDSGVSLVECMTDWANGNDVVRRFFLVEDRSGINPFTKKPMAIKVRGRAIGTQYKPRV